jgi:2-C-methyl-D-erythritol 2,4-cyclodiphosphate synthase/2-C-methyl-D-erythritol 4-phosphate cytidylyltransferase
MKTSIIIVAAGKGERFGQAKFELLLAGKTLLEWCLETVEKLPFEKEVIVITPELGGSTRFESVKNGLKKATGDLVIIHNVANPMATVEDFQRVHDELMKGDVAVFVGQSVVDTLRRVDDKGSETIDRENVWRVQTPQGFRTEILKAVIERSVLNSPSDEIQLFEVRDPSTSVGMTKIVGLETSPFNQKITYPVDLELAQRFLQTETLVGIGEDSHYFDTSGSMMIGGVKIEALPKLHGNSDGDVILHALYNAISSALGKGSLGLTADPMAEQGIVDSSEYLQVILGVMQERGYGLQNISISLECAKPKIEPIAGELKISLANLLNINPEQIGITATSGEGLTAFGRGEGIHCSCIVSLVRINL